VLDALTAVSLASAIIQIVDFSTRVISKCRHIYKDIDGALPEHHKLEIVTQDLTRLSKKLEDAEWPHVWRDSTRSWKMRRGRNGRRHHQKSRNWHWRRKGNLEEEKQLHELSKRNNVAITWFLSFSTDLLKISKI